MMLLVDKKTNDILGRYGTPYPNTDGAIALLGWTISDDGELLDDTGAETGYWYDDLITTCEQIGGWICRSWTETSDGWTSEFDRFDTEKEATEFGRTHVNLINDCELTREYEVYKA